MVRSRDLSGARRRLLQRKFNELIVRMNRTYRAAIAARFVVTLGDEFQGLLYSAAVIPDLLWQIEEGFSERKLRVGIGLGTLDTPLQKYAINIDGPTLHLARAAIDAAKKSKALGGVFRGFGELDEVLNGFAGLLWFQRSRWTPSQRRIVDFLRQGMTQTEAAKKLGITKQVVSKQVVASGCFQYLAAEKAWQAVFQKYVDPMIGSRNASTQFTQGH